VIAGKGLGNVAALLHKIATDTAIPSEAKAMMAILGEEIERLQARIQEMEVRLKHAHKANPVSQRLATMPGIGPITALTVAIDIDPAAFESGRHFAAWLGLTPKEPSTGGKQRMGGISRAGHERLRSLFVLGATSVINATQRSGNHCTTAWLTNLLQRKPRKLVAVALANKMARIAWAMLSRGQTYRSVPGSETPAAAAA
jgi:transposase